MPANEYEQRTDSVLAWKKNQKLGRFDPNAPSLEEQKIKGYEREIDERGECYCYSCATRTFLASYPSRSCCPFQIL